MNGGPGNDNINNDGDAIYLFAVGDGHDTITDSSGTDIIKVSGVANQSDIQLTRDSNNGLVITITSSGDSITVTNHFAINSYKIEKLQLMDGDAVIAELDLVSFFPAIYGTAGNDVIYGASGSDVIYGNSGDDYINGGGGDDVLVGGPGDDTLIGSFWQ